MKRLACVVLTFLSVLSLTLFSVSAEGAKKVESMAVFGDSIACGFMMENYDPSDVSKAQDGFANIIASEYGLTFGSSYLNEAKGGLTSTEIMNAINKADTSTLKNADVIVLSTGTNDIIQAFADVLYRYIQRNSSEFEPFGITSDSFQTLKGLEDTFVQLMTDSSMEEARAKLIENCTNDMVMQRYNDAESVFDQTLNISLSTIFNSGTEADVYLLSLYNPVQHLEVKNDLTDLIDTIIKRIVDKELALESDESYQGRLHIVNLYEEFAKDYEKYLLVAVHDIHPSKAGNRLIADLILTDLNPEYKPPAETSETASVPSGEVSEISQFSDPPAMSQPPAPSNASEISDYYERPPVMPDPGHTDNPPAPPESSNRREPEPPHDDFPVYLVMSLAVAAVIAIIIHFLITHRKNK